MVTSFQHQPLQTLRAAALWSSQGHGILGCCSTAQEELIALQPQLEESTRQTEAAMDIIAKETVEADKVKAVVSEEEAVAAAEAAKVQAIKDECEADLAEALPALQDAIKALDTLTKNDITEVKGMKSPPAGQHLGLWGGWVGFGVAALCFRKHTLLPQFVRPRCRHHRL